MSSPLHAIEDIETHLRAFEIVDDSIISIDDEPYRRHPRGGGLVALSSDVAGSVYVAPHAVVRGCAVLAGMVRLFDRTVVEDSAVIVGMCTLRDRSRVSGEAILRGGVQVWDDAHVDGLARLTGNIKVRHHAHVSMGNLTGSMTIS